MYLKNMHICMYWCETVRALYRCVASNICVLQVCCRLHMCDAGVLQVTCVLQVRCRLHMCVAGALQVKYVCCRCAGVLQVTHVCCRCVEGYTCVLQVRLQVTCVLQVCCRLHMCVAGVLQVTHVCCRCVAGYTCVLQVCCRSHLNMRACTRFRSILIHIKPVLTYIPLT